MFNEDTYMQNIADAHLSADEPAYDDDPLYWRTEFFSCARVEDLIAAADYLALTPYREERLANMARMPRVDLAEDVEKLLELNEEREIGNDVFRQMAEDIDWTPWEVL